MLTVVHDEKEPNGHAPAGVGGSMLDELAREGARRMLAAALQAEVDAYIEQFADQVDDQGRRLVVRNGSHAAREVATAAGAVPVQAPRVNDKRTNEATGERIRFASAILPAWCRKSPKVADVLPCYTSTAYHWVISPPRWNSSWARPPACRRRRSPGSPASGKTKRPRSASAA